VRQKRVLRMKNPLFIVPPVSSIFHTGLCPRVWPGIDRTALRGKGIWGGDVDSRDRKQPSPFLASTLTWHSPSRCTSVRAVVYLISRPKILKYNATPASLHSSLPRESLPPAQLFPLTLLCAPSTSNHTQDVGLENLVGKRVEGQGESTEAKGTKITLSEEGKAGRGRNRSHPLIRTRGLCPSTYIPPQGHVGRKRPPRSRLP